MSNQNGVTNGIAILINNFNIVVDANCHYSAIISDSGNLNAQSYGFIFLLIIIFKIFLFFTKFISTEKNINPNNII